MPRPLASILLVLALAVFAEVLLIVSAILYMVVYGAFNPGHPQEFYERHVNAAGPWISIVCGFPIFFALAYWLARRVTKNPAIGKTGVTGSAIGFYAIWAIMDTAFVLAFGGVAGIAGILPIWLASHASKILGVWAGVRFQRSRNARK
jgi:hypothetical protein